MENEDLKDQIFVTWRRHNEILLHPLDDGPDEGSFLPEGR